MRFLLSRIAVGPSTAPSQSADLNLIEGTLQSDEFSKTSNEGMVLGGMVFHPSSSFPDTWKINAKGTEDIPVTHGGRTPF